MYAGANQAELPSRSDHDLAIYDDDILRRLAFPHMFDRRSAIESPHRDTCEWILNTSPFQSWNDQSHGLLWIKGKPGSGKSTLMSFLYDRLRSTRSTDEIYLEFFFSARGAEMQRHPSGMLRSLLNQIFCQDLDARSILRTSYDEKHRAVGRMDHDWQWTRPVLEALLMQTLLLSTRRKPVTIFLDALDEAGDRNAREIMHYLHRLSDKTKGASTAVKICASSRHYPVPSTLPGLEIWMEHHNANDIMTFVHDRLGLDYRTSYDTPDLERWYDLKAEIVRRAKGVFQWVHLLTPVLVQFLDDGDAIEDAQERIRDLPEELGGVYDHVIRKVIDPRHRSQSLHLFQWILFAERPLSVTELRYALVSLEASSSVSCTRIRTFIRTNAHMQTRIKALSGGLIELVARPDSSSGIQSTPEARTVGNVVKGPDDRTFPPYSLEDTEACYTVVQVIHQSVNDFLREGGLKLLAQLSIETADAVPSLGDSNYAQLSHEAHTMMFSSCINYMSCKDGLCAAVDRLPPSDLRDGANERRLAGTFPFSSYAIEYLLVHAKKASVSQDRDTEEQVERLRSVRYCWARVHAGTQWKMAHRNPCPDWTVMHMASAGDLIDIARFLIRQGCSEIHAADAVGRSPLHIASEYGHSELVDLLIDAGANARHSNAHGLTPFFAAVINKRLSTVQCFLRHRLRLRLTKDDLGNAVSTAVDFGHTEIVETLILGGADLEDLHHWAGQNLYRAVSRGYPEMVQLLLRHGADPNITHSGSMSALMKASYSGNDQIAKLLIDAGADVNAVSSSHGTSLQAAAVHPSSPRITRYLLDAGADVDGPRIGYHGTALHAAVSALVKNPTEATEVIRMLLDAGADVNARNEGRYTVLQIVEKSQSPEVVALLEKHGARDM